ncbi:unnamed protein product [Thelazia callipaeda]|uniref:CTLH domain-containing protein n=1 Tax=Thelazia callipaeda TaxID=103827 RepID=A0A0N5D1D5_THECL|nr:unnamed protein product [Thelazia callipaeda]
MRSINLLKQLILNGEIGEAIEHARALRPGLLEQNKELALLLNCQHYVEIYAKANNVAIPTISSSDTAISTSSPSKAAESRSIQNRLSQISGSDSFAQVYSRKGHPFTITAPNNETLGTVNPFKRRNDEWGILEPSICVTRRSRTCNEGTRPVTTILTRETASSSVICGTSTDEPVDAKSSSGHSSSSGSTYVPNGSTTKCNGSASETNGAHRIVTSATTIIDEDKDPICGDTHDDVIGGADRSFSLCPGWTGGNPRDMMSWEAMEKLLEIGREINGLFGEMVNPPQELVQRMQDTLALICHTKPLDTSLCYLLEQIQRIETANGLNSALREHMGFTKESLLSMHFRTARKLREDLIAMQFGAAVFADVDKLVT